MEPNTPKLLAHVSFHCVIVGQESNKLKQPNSSPVCSGRSAFSSEPNLSTGTQQSERLEACSGVSVRFRPGGRPSGRSLHVNTVRAVWCDRTGPGSVQPGSFCAGS